MIDQWKPDVVIYHDPCMDGFTAAWAVWKRWPDATFVGANYGKAAPDVAGKNVLIVDFSYKRPELDALAQAATSIVILDHHKSAAAELEPFTFSESSPGAISPEDVNGMLRDLAELNRPPVIAIFDMERSGARMAWDFAHPERDVPLIVTLIEDRDLWLFRHEQTRAFHLRMSIEEKTFATWDVASHAMVHVLAAEGGIMGIYRDWLVGRIAGQAEIGTIGDHRVPVVDCPYELASEVGDRLCGLFPDRPFAAMRVRNHDGTSFSLRSRGGFDCSTVAVRYGGGGHAGAAGFRASDEVPANPVGEDFLVQLRRVNGERYAAWTGDGVEDPLYLSNEFGGEAGEVQNIVKKLVREQRGWRGSRATVDQLADEIADGVICLDNLARGYGIDLAEAVTRKFNRTSAANDFPQRLAALKSADAASSQEQGASGEVAK